VRNKRCRSRRPAYAREHSGAVGGQHGIRTSAQQSNVVDKRITPRWMGHERADTVIGAFVVVVGAAALMIALRRRADWRMPPLALLQRPAWSRGRLVGMWALRIYLVLAVLLLLVKAIELATGH